MAESDPAWSPALAPGVRLTHDRVRDTDLLLMPEQVIVLNTSASAIVARCRGSESVQSIVAALREEYDGDSLAGDVQRFLARARREGWVV